jgi:hypothetical protein
MTYKWPGRGTCYSKRRTCPWSSPHYQGPHGSGHMDTGRSEDKWENLRETQ